MIRQVLPSIDGIRYTAGVIELAELIVLLARIFPLGEIFLRLPMVAAVSRARERLEFSFPPPPTRLDADETQWTPEESRVV